MMRAADQPEYERLTRLAAKRNGKPGFEANVAEISARIAELEAGSDPEPEAETAE